MCAPSSLSQASTRSKHCHPVTHLNFVFFILFFNLELFLERRRARQGCRGPVDVAAAMVFCVSCGNKLAGRYCRQCGAEDSQWTAHAQSQVPVLTTVMIPKPGKQGTGRPASRVQASHILHEVHKLQQKNAISAYLFRSGLDDQSPEDWNDHEVRTDLVVPDPSDPSSDEGGDSRKGEGGGDSEMQGTAPVLNIPSPVITSSEEEEDLEHDMEEEQEEKKEASRKRKKT